MPMDVLAESSQIDALTPALRRSKIEVPFFQRMTAEQKGLDDAGFSGAVLSENQRDRA